MEDVWMIEAVIQPFKLDAVTLALEEVAAFRGMTVSDCRGVGDAMLSDVERAPAAPSEHAAQERRRRGDADMIDFTAKVKLELAVPGRDAANLLMEIIARVAHTGRRGDGRIFAWPLSKVVRIRTLEEGEIVV